MSRLGASANCAALLEAFAAKYWTSLRRLERHSSLLAAMGTGSASFDLLIRVRRRRSDRSCPLCFAGFAALGLVLELLVVKEELFARREEKLRAAVYALQQPVLEFHETPPFSRELAQIPLPRGYRARFDSRDLFPTSGSALHSLRNGPHQNSVRLRSLVQMRRAASLGGPL